MGTQHSREAFPLGCLSDSQNQLHSPVAPSCHVAACTARRTGSSFAQSRGSSGSTSGSASHSEADAAPAVAADPDASWGLGGGSTGGQASAAPRFSGEDDVYEDHLMEVPRDTVNKRISRADKRAAKRAEKGELRTLKYHNILVPPEVTVEAVGTQLRFSGPLGSNAMDLQRVDAHGMAAYKLERGPGGRITQICLAGPDKAVLGTARTLLNNKIHGVMRGYLVYMQLVGVGYRVSKEVKSVTIPVPQAPVVPTPA